MCAFLFSYFANAEGEEPPVQLQPGVVVETVARNSAGEKAGIQEGDVLLTWTRAELQGEIESPFDLAEAEVEQGPRGAVTLLGSRQAESKVWILNPSVWGITVRPNFGEPLLSRYHEGQLLAKAGKLNEAAERWRAAAVEVEKSNRS